MVDMDRANTEFRALREEEEEEKRFFAMDTCKTFVLSCTSKSRSNILYTYIKGTQNLLTWLHKSAG